MSAYLIVMRDEPIRDPEAMAEYQRLTRKNAGDHNLKPLVVYGNISPLEGNAPDGLVMLEFPTVEDAKAWYNSPGYQAALPYRLKAASHRALIVEGL